jgi:hypothetical protein
MATVDKKVLLFIHFGLTFRKEFMYLTAKLFKKLRVGDSKQYSKMFSRGSYNVHDGNLNQVHCGASGNHDRLLIIQCVLARAY